jgi:UDPglucose 6-dehydrogenase
MKKKLAIIGSGVIGSATGKGFVSKGYKVVFYDVKKETIDSLKKQGFDARHFNSLNTEENDAFFLTVPTPTKKGAIDLSYIKKVAEQLGRKLKERKGYFVVIVRSTVLPGTTEDLVTPILEAESGKKAGVDFGVAMNPEYLRAVNAEKDFRNPWIVAIGSLDKKTQRFMREVFGNYQCPTRYVSIKEAETQKYVHNLFNAIKVAFFNEMRMACDVIGINPDKIFEITTESAEGFWNKKYGIRNMGPYDGMCLPKDTQAFLNWSQKNNIKLDLLSGAISSNKKFEIFWKKNKGR